MISEGLHPSSVEDQGQAGGTKNKYVQNESASTMIRRAAAVTEGHDPPFLYA